MSPPSIWYPRPILVVARDHRRAQSFARALELNDDDWRPVCSEREVNGYTVAAALLDEPGWREIRSDYLEGLLEQHARRLIFVDSTALQCFRARTRAQAMEAIDVAGETPGKVWVPLEGSRDPTDWGVDTYTVEGPVIELQRYSPDGLRVVEVEGIIAGGGGAGRVRIKTRRHDAVDRLQRAFRLQNDNGPFVFVAGEVVRIERTENVIRLQQANRDADVIVGGFNVTTGNWEPQNKPPSEGIGQQDMARAYLDLGRSEREAAEQMRLELARHRAAQQNRLVENEQLERARQQLRSTTRNSEEAEATMEIALRMARTSGMSVTEAITAITQLRQMSASMAAGGDNVDRVIRDLERTLDRQQQPKPTPEKPPSFEAPRRKIDLEE